jgi:hypothetical protein
VSEALPTRLDEGDAALIRACEIANQDQDVAEIEGDLDETTGGMTEPK